MELPQWVLEHLNIAALGALLTFLTILATFYSQVAVPLYNGTLKPMFRLFNAIYESPSRIESLDSKISKEHAALNSKLDILIKEFKPNGGTSLKDQINRLEVAVSISESQRMLLLNSVPNGIWTSDVNGRYTWVNDYMRKATSANSSDFLGDNWENLIYPEDRQKVAEEWDRAIKQQRDFNLHYRMYNLKTNSAIEVHGVATPARNFDGKIIGWNGVVYFT